MPTPGSLARAHYRQQQLIVKKAAKAAEAVWAAVDVGNLDLSWAAAAHKAENLLALGQYAAASHAANYVLDQALAQGVDAATDAAVDPRGFSGVAADGRPLSSLLRGAIIDTKVAIGSGMSTRDAMLRGQYSLSLMFVNETAQAGRDADHVAMVSTPTMTGYIRMLSGTSCSRCTVLAGRWYHYNQGFLRHPHCDCIHVPAAESVGVQDIRTNPMDTFHGMSTAEQDRVFTKAGAEAIRNGADMGRVVNARQSTFTPKGRHLSRGTPTKRTVDDCLVAAHGDREELVRLLRQSGYFR